MQWTLAGGGAATSVRAHRQVKVCGSGHEGACSQAVEGRRETAPGHQTAQLNVPIQLFYMHQNAPCDGNDNGGNAATHA